MPWHSREDGVGMELELHYQVFKGPNGNQLKRRRSAAILTIDKNNVNVIGPVSIAQRLMFATAAAAAAVPKNNTTRYGFQYFQNPSNRIKSMSNRVIQKFSMFS